MKAKKWLTINDKGACKLTTSKPKPSFNEVSIFLEINLPDALFNKPRLEAKITVPDEAAVAGMINSIVVDNVKDVIEQATGLTFSIAVIQDNNEER